jgi:hypothetical protein
MTLTARIPAIFLLSCAAVAALTPSLRAQDAKAENSRQRAAAAANLKKAAFARSTIVESRHFIIATTLSEERAKALGTTLDRVVPLARKALQFEDKDEAWKGKLAVYYLPDSSDFKTFVRDVVVEQPEGVHYSLRTDEPFLVDPADAPASATEADRASSAAAIVAGAYLRARASGAQVPEWLAGGFGRATVLRTEGLNSKRYLSYRSSARSLAIKGSKPTELWAETPPAGAQALATSFAEYLAYGPGAPNFLKLLVGLRADDNGNAPGVAAAFEAAGWKDLPALEAAWKKWATAR